MSEQGCTPKGNKQSRQGAQKRAQDGPDPAALYSFWRRTKTWAAVLAFGSCLVLAFSTRADETAPSVSVPKGVSADAPADATGGGLELVVGHGRLLHLCEPAESVSLSDQSITDLSVVSPDRIYVFAKKIGTTNLNVISAETNLERSNEGKGQIPQPAQRASLPLRVVAEPPANAAKRVSNPALEVRLFGCRPQRHTDTTAPGKAAQKIDIRLRFAEVSRSGLQTLAVNWQTFDTGNFSYGLLTGAGGSGRFDSSAQVDALQRNGALNMLAEPSVTLVAGQEASFLAGGEYPVPVPGRGVVAMTYKPYGVLLNFTPALLKNNRIALHVRPEVCIIFRESGLKINGIEVLGFRVRRGDTTIALDSGQTFAIGGLLYQGQLDKAGVIDKMLATGDLPVIGALFRSPRFQRGETELAVFVTPYAVTPVSNAPVPPNDKPAPSPPPPPPAVPAE
jgi:pilus assembly protein CpaC